MLIKSLTLVIALIIPVVCHPKLPVEKSEKSEKPIKSLNIILMIGDGMGPAHVKAYRKFMDDPKTLQEEKTEFDHYLVGSVSTESADKRENITDSAAAATAYSTGKRIVNDALAIDNKGQPIETVLERAKKQGMSTGMVVTSQVVHATPAAFASHHADRRAYNKIADQYFDNQFNNIPMFDVLLGGGTKYFKRKDRDLIQEFSDMGFQFVSNREQLLSADSKKVLGLFAKVGLDKMWDRPSSTPSLAEMTKAALKPLAENAKGFFLMVEGSKIDWASHEKDIVGVMSEMQDFEAALKEVIQFAKKDGNTLVIVTSDHETGGLSVGSGESGAGFYYWGVDVIKTFKYTTAKMASKAQLSGDLVKAFQDSTSLQLTEQEKIQLRQADLTDWYQTRRAATQIINKRSFTGWTSFEHTGVDVNLYAYGPGSERLRGHIDNLEIGRYIFELLENNK